MFDSCEKKFIHHLVIKVTGQDFEQLIAIERTGNGTATTLAPVIVNHLQDWNIFDRIFFLNFDTTAVNTGRFGGIAALLQRSYPEAFGFEREFILLNCRHHEHELFLAKSIKSLFPTVGDRYPFFDKFRSLFDKLDSSAIEPYFGDAIPRDEKVELLKFISDQSRIKYGNSEYVQLLEACSLFLLRCEQPKLVKPGRYTHSRWMKPLIQLIYIYLFRNQLDNKQFDLPKIERLCLFGVRLYSKFWFQSPVARFAAVNDLNLFKNLRNYNDLQIRDVCLKTFDSHSSYLNSDLIGMAFFDERLSSETLAKMVKNLIREPKPFKISENTQIEDLIDKSSFNFFTKSKLPHDFFSFPPSQWSQSETYCYCNNIVRSLQVVNDTSERTVSLCKSFVNTLSKDNSDLSNILQVVEMDIQDKPKPTKHTYGLRNQL